MTKFLMVLMIAFLITGCSTPSQAQINDNGKPGQIKAIVFFDANRNGAKDQGESGLTDHVSISQEISCPPANYKKTTTNETDADGETVFKDLKPGRYCVAYMGSKGVTTKMTVEVALSSEQTAQVAFGLSEK